MSSVAAAAPDLSTRPFLRDTAALYRLLFRRSVALTALVFALVELLRVAFSYDAESPILAAFVGLAATFGGTAFVQGALTENVRDAHLGRTPAPFSSQLDRVLDRVGALVGVSVAQAVGVGLGCLLFLVPGVVLAARWALAVPLAMIEHLSAREALARSNELVKGRTREVVTLLLNVGLRAGVGSFALGLVVALALGGGFVATWFAATLAASLATPYAAHAMSVLYYRLAEPDDE
jgi:hypothetical protein